MKAEYFYCPHCRTRLKKSAAAWVLGEVGRSELAGSAANVACPHCGRAIDAAAMSAGKYDGETSVVEGLAAVGIFLGVAVYSGAQGYGLTAAVGWGIAAVLLAAGARDVCGWLGKRLRRRSS